MERREQPLLRLGLDFGTSNCAAAVWSDRGATLIPVDGQDLVLPSALYVSAARAEDYEPDAEAVDREMRSARSDLAAQNRVIERDNEVERTKAKQATNRGDRYTPRLRGLLTISEERLRAEATVRLRRAHAEQATAKVRGQGMDARISAAGEVLIGKSAVQSYLHDPNGGDYFRSPKTFLAAELKTSQRSMFVDIVSRMLRAIHDAVRTNQNADVEHVVIGRPVEYHGGRGALGEKEALDSMRAAAAQAGFTSVEFQFEPIAAAVDYEQRCTRDEVLLVLDCGGGTTDCSIMKVGPSHRTRADRRESILANKGLPEGGLLLDVQLSKMLFPPILGHNTLLKSGLHVPSAPFFDALEVHSLPNQRKFLADAYQMPLAQILREAREPRLIERLETVRERNLMQRLQHGAESTRIGLSENELCVLNLDELEMGLSVSCSRQQLQNALEGRMERMLDLVHETLLQAGMDDAHVPDAVYVTGGVGQSPLLRRMLAERFPQLPPVQTHSFLGSVAAGLARLATRGTPTS